MMLRGLSRGQEGRALETRGSPQLKALEVTLSPQQTTALVQAIHFPLKTAVFHLGNRLLLRMSLSTWAEAA